MLEKIKAEAKKLQQTIWRSKSMGAKIGMVLMLASGFGLLPESKILFVVGAALYLFA